MSKPVLVAVVLVLSTCLLCTCAPTHGGGESSRGEHSHQNGAVEISRVKDARSTALLTALRFDRSRLVGIAVGGSLEDDPGELVQTQDGGISWIRSSLGNTMRLYDVSFVTDKVFIAVGLGGRVIRSVDSGTTWSQVRDGHEWLSGVAFVSPKRGFVIGAADGEALMLVSDDGGRTWQSMAVPTSCAKSSLRVIRFRDPKRGVIAGTDGAVLVTDDGGHKWQARVVGKGYLRGIAFQGEREIWICGSPGVLLKSEDFGESFATRAFPYQDKLNSVAFVTKELGWITSMSGHIYQTENGGLSWHSIHQEKREPLTGVLAPSWEKPGFVVGGGGTILRMDLCERD